MTFILVPCPGLQVEKRQLMNQISKEFLKKIPKTDLHLHLDGSIRLSTLIELAKESCVELPSYTEEGLQSTVFKSNYSDLEQYLAGFVYTCSVMRNSEQLERIAYELALDNQSEGVRYIEVRFAPQLHSSEELNVIDVFKAVNRGLSKAKEEFNSKREIQQGTEPHFDYGIISCAMRYFNKNFSSFHRKFLQLHKYTAVNRIFGLASLEAVGAAVEARDIGLPVVGVDLAGPEKGFPPAHHREAYYLAHRNFLKKTVHAGEAYGPESIFQAITELNADRIGHGTSLFNIEAIQEPGLKDPGVYIENLAQFIADRRITIEVCLTSNLQTNPHLKDLKNHPMIKMLDHKLSITLCTDNRTVSNTTVTDEYFKAVKAFDLDLKDLKNLVVYGFKRSFFPGKYREKRAYVRNCMKYFEKIEEEYLSK